MKFTAVGDYLQQRRWPGEYEGFSDVRDFIMKGQARYLNLETVFPGNDSFGNQFYGGTYLRADPVILNDARKYGFNMLSFANNHSLDYSYDGLLKTLDEVNKSGFINAGVGRNLDEAAAPGYLDTIHGSVALIGVVSTMMNVAAIAGRQSRRVPGRPGVNGLRIDEKIIITKEQFNCIQNLASESCINAKDDISRAEGFSPALPEGILALQALRFELGDRTQYVTHPNKTDMDRIRKYIYEAKMASDYVIVSMHSHELSGSNKENPGDFYVEFAHNCIDEGAHSVIGHGPHILRPMEIYKGRPIFYSLGNFIFQEELLQYAPEDLYEKFDITSDSTMRDLYNKRTKNYTRGLMADKRVFESVIPYFEIENDIVTRIELMPIEMGFELERWQVGFPKPGYGHGIIERYAEMSKKFGTIINLREDGLGEVKL